LAEHDSPKEALNSKRKELLILSMETSVPPVQFPSAEAAFQDLFDKVGQLSQRVWELEKTEYVPKQAFFLLVTMLSAAKVIDETALREIVIGHAQRLAESTNADDCTGLRKEVLLTLAKEILDWFPSGPNEPPPIPKFTVIDGGKN
jgi:hypothetical protein